MLTRIIRTLTKRAFSAASDDVRNMTRRLECMHVAVNRWKHRITSRDAR